ncbi:MAG: glycosyltransferase family 4 protein [Muribaculaceae bacterium]|nr:glycosyltransferase family 4 protein [Muribaculaceae bacterium]
MNKDVLIVASEFPPGPGGIGNHAFSMAKAFDRKGFNVVVVACGDFVDKDTIERFDSRQTFRIVRYKDAGFGLKYLLRLMTIAKNLRPNIILSGKFSLWMALWIKMFSRKSNLTSILHGTEVNLPNSFLRRLTHKSIATADNIVAVSNYTRDLLPDWILRHRDVHVIPNGIDLTDIPDPKDAGILKGKPAILTVGNVTPRKGQHRVIKALPEILKKYPDAHYHIVGLPTYKNDFYELAKSLGVEKSVTFHGRAESFDQVCSFYKAADVFAILSENQSDGDCEGFGIVILEAGYFFLPAIGAKGCGIEDAIRNGANGCLVDGDDKEEIAEAIKTITDRYDSFAKGARAWALDHDWNNIVNDLIKLMK